MDGSENDPHSGTRDNTVSSANDGTNSEEPWDGFGNISSGKTLPTPTMPDDSSEIPAHDTGEQDADGGTEDLNEQVYEANLVPHESSNDSSENCVGSVNGDEVVVDISPSGYSLAALDSQLSNSSEYFCHAKNMYVFDNTFTVMPRSISRLLNLRNLKFFSNEVRLLPDEVGEIATLEHLHLKLCPSGLGSLPPFAKLINLKTLELHQTPLRHSALSLPPEISSLQRLTRLAVCNFSISYLPPGIGDLKSLQELDISFNKLKSLPNTICSLTALKHLRAENNKLVELPSGLSNLPNLNSIDVAHNKLTSLVSLGLSAMTSLKALNAKFNKLRSTCQIPEWIICNLEGNPSPSVQVTSSGELDSEVLPSAPEGDDLSSQPPISPSAKELIVPRNTAHNKSKRGWKRHDVQQLQARQDRLNLSRKLKAEYKDGLNGGGSEESVTDVSRQATLKSGRLLDGDAQECIGSEERRKDDGKGDMQSVKDGDGIQSTKDIGQECCCKQSGNSPDSPSLKKDDVSVNLVSEIHESSDYSSALQGIAIDSHKNVLNDDKTNQSVNATLVEEEGGSDEPFVFKSKQDLETDLVNGRRKGGPLDRNPKPKKRRKSTQSFSEVSLTYCTRSLCGVDDYLEDGFYDAGRERPFSSLEILESEQPCLDTREVIVVDRERDEELDVIAVMARHFLTRLELAGQNLGHAECLGLTSFQKAAILSLFVSDCLGGSDKMMNVTNTRRSVLGSHAGVAFVCSCSSHSTAMSSSNETATDAIPTVNMLCERAVKLFKVQRQSNVIPLGSLPYGVCRHRAILFKYLCDRTSIPCELVRGYLDYVPHAWNVVVVSKENKQVRMLIDSCRPLDIREEEDTEYFCRYIPSRCFQSRSLDTKLSTVRSEDIISVLHEEIGRGASGSVVRRCRLGSFTAAAKVHLFDHTSKMLYEDVLGKFLSELRVLRCLGEHPHIVSFYGHEIIPAATLAPDAEKRNEAVQLVMFMEYVQGFSLETALAQYSKDGRKHMPAREAGCIAQAVAHALSHVHSKGIIHRDVKSSNVLVDLKANVVDGTPSIKLCDFDSAVPLSSSSLHNCYLAHRGVPPVEVCVGTPRWMAPEVFRAMYRQYPYGLEADMWSFGCMLLEMLTLEVPYAGLPEVQIQSQLQSGQRPKLPAEIEDLVSETSSKGQASSVLTMSEEDLAIMKVLVDLFKSCTEVCPRNRPTSLEAYEALSRALNSSFCGDANDSSNTVCLNQSPVSGTVKAPCLEKSGADVYRERTDKRTCQDRNIDSSP